MSSYTFETKLTSICEIFSSGVKSTLMIQKKYIIHREQQQQIYKNNGHVTGLLVKYEKILNKKINK